MVNSEHTTAIFRADWSRETGLGHVMRLLAIAQGFAARGHTPVFVTANEQSTDCPLEAAGMRVHRFNDGTGTLSDAMNTLQVAEQLGSKLCFVDGYSFTADYYETLMERGVRVVALADWPHSEFPVDVLVNVNLGPSVAEYQVSSTTLSLFGPAFVPLRSQFLGPNAQGIRDEPAVPLKLMLTFGATDPGRRTARVLSLLPASPQLSVTCVVGAHYDDHGELELAARCARRSGQEVEILQGVDDMAAVMGSVHAAVCAGGSTLWELAKVGVPVLAYVVALNQAAGVRQLAAHGCLISGGWLADRSSVQIQQSVAEFVSDAGRRSSVAATFSKLVDGGGVARILDAALAVNAHGTETTGAVAKEHR